MYEVLVRINKPKFNTENNFISFIEGEYTIFVDKLLVDESVVILSKNNATSEFCDREISVEGLIKK